MSRRSIRKIIARARRDSYRALKSHIMGMICFDDITVESHLVAFSQEYMRVFWSHLATGCSYLRRLTEEETCATPKEIIKEIGRQCTIGIHAGTIEIQMRDSIFYLKEYGDLISCGPNSYGNTVLNIRLEDVVGLITAYDNEARRCSEVVPGAIREALAESVALEIALTNAKTAAKDIINRHGIEIEATDVGSQRVKYSVSLRRNPLFETRFWASMDELKPRLMCAVRSLEHQEIMSFR